VPEIDRVFCDLQHRGKKALIPYIVAHYPDPETCVEILKLLAGEGDVIEIGVPFSDPVADGPTIQHAGQVALSHGTNLKSILELVERVRRQTSTPVVLMSYFNPIYRYGVRSFAADAAEAGVAGVIIPDLPPEEADEWIRYARTEAIDTIFLVAPTSSDERIDRVTELSRGFIYYVSVTGVTGTSAGAVGKIAGQVARIRRASRLPVAVGFGISTPEDARCMAEISDAVIVGSALIRVIQQVVVEGCGLGRVAIFLKSLRAAIS